VRAVGNEFTNPESDLRRAVKNEFTDPNSQFRTTALSPEVNNIVSELQAHDWGPLNSQFENVFDPNKNGLADVYRMFHGDKTELFNFIKDNLSKVASDNKEGLDEAFRPLLHAFGEDRELSALIGQHIESFPQTRAHWERVMQDPDTYFDILSVMISIAAVVTTGPAAPATIAASRAALTAARVLTHAAQGKQITNAELAAIVVDIVVPYRTGAFKDLPKLAQAGGITLKADALKPGIKKVAEFAGQVASNYFPGAALLLTELSTDRSGAAAALAVGNALQSIDDAPGVALPGEAPAAAPGAAAAPGQAAPQAAAVPGAALPAAVPAAPQAPPAVRLDALSRRAARAAAPPQAALPVAQAAVRPLQPLEVPRPIFNQELERIPISSRQAARLNSMARTSSRVSDAAERNGVVRRRMDRAAVDQELEEAAAEAESGSSRMAVATDAFLRARAQDEDTLNRFAFSPFF
jgi:hypothetical protein